MLRPARARSLTASLAGAAAVALTGCGGGTVRSMPSVIGAAPSAPSTATAAPTTMTASVSAAPAATVPLTAAPASAPTVPVLAPVQIDGGPKGLSTGSKGAPVAALENRLAALKFNPGKHDGSYDSSLFQAVMAFQKQQGLKRTGKADPETLAAVSKAGLGAPMVPAGEPTRVEIDLKRQMAQFWKAGALVRVLPVSTGNGERYCVPKDKGGGCDVAVTPGGSYRADRKIQGLRVSKLGSLYDPVYFNGGIAIHGSPSVPAGPASHGCIRVPMWESRWVHDNVALGDPVYVVGGTVSPVPFGETAPDEGADVTAPADPAAEQ